MSSSVFKNKFCTSFFIFLLAAANFANASEMKDYKKIACIGKNNSAPVYDDKLYLLSVNERNDYILNSGLRIVDASGSNPIMLTREETLAAFGTYELNDALDKRSDSIGFEKSVVNALRFPMANDPNISLVLNKLCFWEGKKNNEILLRVSAKKSYTSSAAIDLKFGIWYRWTIKIDSMFVGEVNQVIDEKQFNLKLHARAPSIQVTKFELGFDVNDNDKIDSGEVADVRPFNKDGSINPLYAVRHPNNTDCIDIDIKDSRNTGNLGKIETLDLKKSTGVNKLKKILSGLKEEKTGIQFCAGSCSGYMLAASNGG